MSSVNQTSKVKQRRKISTPGKSLSKQKESEEPNETENGLHNQENTSSTIWKRAAKRTFLSFIILCMVYYSTYKSNSETTLATSKETISRLKGQELTCSDDYKLEREKFEQCAPDKCGRIVTDSVVTQLEAEHLLSLAKRGFTLGGSSGSASILDLHTGALSYKTNFVNVYKLLQKNAQKGDNKVVFTEEDFEVYTRVKNKIHQTIGMQFGIPLHLLFLTQPTFFSKITSIPAQTIHDEYWHVHVDKQTYKSFHYTSLLYLSTYAQDFEGGRFVFVGKQNMTIEPKLGRLSAFTSGSENGHYVEKVRAGTRYALTVSFTCDADHAINDPFWPRKD